MTNRRSPEAFEIDAWRKRRERLDAYGERVLGATGWRLFERFGRLMAGPKCGLYVSALDTDEVIGLLDALACGKVLLIHLMHRHVSGNFESSRLLLVKGTMVMRFADRDEAALRSERQASARLFSDDGRVHSPASPRPPRPEVSHFRSSERGVDSKFEPNLARFQHPIWKCLVAFFVWASPQRHGFGAYGERTPLLLEESSDDFDDSEVPGSESV